MNVLISIMILIGGLTIYEIVKNLTLSEDEETEIIDSWIKNGEDYE